MKKLMALFISAFMFVACNQSETFKGSEYQLVDAPNGAKITLAFDKTENRFMGKVVNNYFGSYESEGNSLIFGNAMSTMMAGNPDLMEAEHIYLQLIREVNSHKFVGGNLVLISNDGSELTFKKIGEVLNKK